MPDLHPFIVHFPIAWLPIVLIFAVRDAAANRPPLPVRSGTATDALLAITFLFSLAAAVTGDAALTSYLLDGTAAETAARHAKTGGAVAWLTGLALVVRGALHLHLRTRGSPRLVAGPGQVPRSPRRSLRSAESVRVSRDMPGDRPGDTSADRRRDRPADRRGDRPADPPGDRPRDRPGGTSGDRKAVGLRWATVTLVFLATAAAWLAGYHGGRLVHEEGVTRATAAPAPSPSDRPDVYRSR